MFETYAASELPKKKFNRGEKDNLFFYRDQKGNELDIVLDNGFDLDLVEIKLSQTLNTVFAKGFKHFPEIDNIGCKKHIIFGGNNNCLFHRTNVYIWKNIGKVFDS